LGSGKEVTVDARGIRDDDHFSPVGGVDLAMDEFAAFEPVDHAGICTGREAGELSEASRRGGPVRQEQADRPKVCGFRPTSSIASKFETSSSTTK
jgi:hypothetical protein